ncbi:MAG: hypothetical protein KME20_02480 [Kaiparowitsia implicata GSE-PSE-MK54-09C]|jgi:hypothetical protein|nr:hypothetical protein [Kaiparowitsia implicata GSE-PSE-MK54-09C]
MAGATGAEPGVVILAIALLLSAGATYSLQHQLLPQAMLAALLSVGLLLATGWHGVQRWYSPQSGEGWMVWGAIAVLGLAAMAILLGRSDRPLFHLYCAAARAWSGLGVLVGLSVLTVACLWTILLGYVPSGSILAAVTLGIGAIALHLVQRPTNGGFLALGWAAQCAVILIWQPPDVAQWEIATLALGLASYGLGEGWTRWQRCDYWPSWHGVPLLYAGLGLALAHTTRFTPMTGIYTLIAGGIAGGVGQRDRRLRAITAVGLLTIAIAIGELSWVVVGVGRLDLHVVNQFVLLQWAAAIASGICLMLLRLLWARWSVAPKLWRRSRLVLSVLPILVVLLTTSEVNVPTLLLTAAFYASIASRFQHRGFSYLSLALLVWAVLKFLTIQAWLTPLGLSSVVGGCLLYVAQVEPTLTAVSARTRRHLLRSLATGLICLTAFYQAMAAPGNSLTYTLLAIALSVGFLVAGVCGKIRAYLYLGGLVLGLQGLHLLGLAMQPVPLVMGAVLGLLGLLLVGMGAIIKPCRHQVTNWVNGWLSTSQTWQ